MMTCVFRLRSQGLTGLVLWKQVHMGLMFVGADSHRSCVFGNEYVWVLCLWKQSSTGLVFVETWSHG